MAIRKGTTVQWRKGNALISGKVEKSYCGKVTVSIGGMEFTRHGSKDNRVLLIRDCKGENVLKLLNEVERISEPFYD
jgi:hypothetical protein